MSLRPIYFLSSGMRSKIASSYIQEVLLPVILETQETLNRIKKDLDSLTQKAVRI